MVERLDPDQLLSVFVQKGLPIVRWNYDCTIWCSCKLCGVDIGRGVDDVGKVSQSSNLRAFVSVYMYESFDIAATCIIK